MKSNKVQFSVATHAAWAPNLVTHEEWLNWAKSPHTLKGENEPGVVKMPAMLRRRAGFLGKMALEVAYQCLDGQDKSNTIPTVFCTRHGDVPRGLELLLNVAQNEPVSPTNFGLAVHNAIAGLFSIARKDHANHIAISAGQSTIEHGVIEACSLLADGAEEVLLVSYDNRLPPMFAPYVEYEEQPYAWAWLMVPAKKEVRRGSIELSWKKLESQVNAVNTMPAGLDVFRFYLSGDSVLERQTERKQWVWSRHA